MSDSPKCRGVHFYSPRTGELIASACKRRTCAQCGPGYWLPRKREEFLAGLADPYARYRLITLTGPRLPRSEGRQAWNRVGIKEAWNRLRASLSRKEKFEFWRTAELQDRGVVHYHVVTRGLTAPNRRVKELATKAGFGHVDVKEFDVSVPFAAWRYVSKEALILHVPGVGRYAPFAKSRGWLSADSESPFEGGKSAGEGWLRVRSDSSRAGVRLLVCTPNGDVALEDGLQLLDELQSMGVATTRLGDQEKIKQAMASPEPNTAASSQRSASEEADAPPEAP